MPLTSTDFPVEVQVAFFIFNMLSDRWDGMSGTYLGKDWNIVFELFDVYGIYDDKSDILYFMKLYEYVLVEYRAKEAERRRKASERKQAASGGKTYTHNIQG